MLISRKGTKLLKLIIDIPNRCNTNSMQKVCGKKYTWPYATYRYTLNTLAEFC